MSIGSVGIPKAAIVLGSVTPPQGDIVDLLVHLGCTKEVSSFELLLQNWSEKYSPSGSYPILVGANGSISLGRGSNVPQLISLRVENIEYQPFPEGKAFEYYLKVSGRCYGERLFRNTVTKTYDSMKGEAIVKDLMDNFAGLGHIRSGTELVQNTSTTYYGLDYEDTPLWDILRMIAQTADNSGVIGYDFRVAPDDLFEFFPIGSKNASISLVNLPEVATYRKEISRVRNKIYVYGAPQKLLPSDQDSWTESLTGWSCGGTDTLSLDSAHKVLGNYSIYDQSALAYPNPSIQMLYQLVPASPGVLGLRCGGNTGYKRLNYAYRLSGSCSGGNYWFQLLRVCLYAPDYQNLFQKDHWIPDNLQQDQNWHYNQEMLGKEYMYQAGAEDYWVPVGNSDWKNIKYIYFYGWGVVGPSGTQGYIGLNIDKMFFDQGRFSAVEEDSSSESAYGLRELAETDDDLLSDAACDLRAKSLRDYYKSPAEYISVKSTVVDYGNTPVLPADMIHVTLPNENVDGNYRVDSVEYHGDAGLQTLETTFELGKIPPQLADYLYGLRKRVTLEKIARSKAAGRQ
jgi:hypothetical protein